MPAPLPRMRAAANRKQAQRELQSRRETVAEQHRAEAAEREKRAELAEHKVRIAQQVFGAVIFVNVQNDANAGGDIDLRAFQVDGLAQYGGTDLLCYRAEDEALAAMQARDWQPLLDWAAATHGAPLRPSHCRSHSWSATPG